MGNHSIVLAEAVHHFDFALVEVEDVQLSHVVVFVRHPDQALAVKVERDRILVELNYVLTERAQGALFQVAHADGRQAGHVVWVLLVLLALQVDDDHAIVVLVVEGEGSLAVLFVRLVVRVVDDLPEIN
eukprot:CAMPEP_0170494198 /NCGR_PEP_ID=MMETSP0208-20121228/14504_1 /TAXON_ID=197538 /ORGANISM="Strombidium inclinatum, Strain S3" /LENGTH=128 /DNA_ID=CAMNT_0010770219 /DNA_START=464 /DNA_END=850 /DNA_ORIENTATION=-